MAYLKFKPLLPRVVFNELITVKDLDYETLGMFSENEEAKFISKGNRDLFIITNTRILLINYKLIIGNRREILSIPYKNIVTTAIEIENSDVLLSINTTNVYELEIKLAKPISLDDVYEMYHYINDRVI